MKFCSSWVLILFLTASGASQSTSRGTSGVLPDEPSAAVVFEDSAADPVGESSRFEGMAFTGAEFPALMQSSGGSPQTPKAGDDNRAVPGSDTVLDSEGKPVPMERLQPKRILGFMPNFRSVSGGAVAHRPGWKYNFTIATHQAFDYSSFMFLGLTSISAEGINSHPALGKGVGGFYAYTWRGFLDKTDGTYLSAWFLPSLLHEDTRYYGLGRGSVLKRSLYVISRQAVARTYGGRDTPNIAGLGGKVLTQVISRYYYPPSAASFSVLATKFGYSVMRDVAFTAIREFYPSIAAHYIRKHRERQAQLQGQPS